MNRFVRKVQTRKNTLQCGSCQQLQWVQRAIILQRMTTQQIQKAGGIVTQANKETGELEVYLIHRPRYDDWTLPKGHIDPNEKIEKAALREVFEETGFMCENISKLPVHTYDMPNGDGVTDKAAQAEVHFFHMKVLAASNPIDSEADQGKWVSFDEACTLISYESSQEYLQHVRENLTQ